MIWLGRSPQPQGQRRQAAGDPAQRRTWSRSRRPAAAPGPAGRRRVGAAQDLGRVADLRRRLPVATTATGRGRPRTRHLTAYQRDQDVRQHVADPASRPRDIGHGAHGVGRSGQVRAGDQQRHRRRSRPASPTRWFADPALTTWPLRRRMSGYPVAADRPTAALVRRRGSSSSSAAASSGSSRSPPTSATSVSASASASATDAQCRSPGRRHRHRSPPGDRRCGRPRRARGGDHRRHRCAEARQPLHRRRRGPSPAAAGATRRCAPGVGASTSSSEITACLGPAPRCTARASRRSARRPPARRGCRKRPRVQNRRRSPSLWETRNSVLPPESISSMRAVALLPERPVADGQHLVDEHDRLVEAGDDGEAEPHLHAAGEVPERHVEELADLGELDDLVELLVDLRAGTARAAPRSARCCRAR